MKPAPVDPVALTADLIRCPSVTPTEGGALQLLQQLLSSAGFDCRRVDRNNIPNLFARWGRRGANRTFGFNGHTDVVPVGDIASWTHDPFGGEIIDGWLWGRGATDMKSGVAAFVAAAIDFVQTTPPDGAVILTITGDEEGVGVDGTLALLDDMAARNEAMSVCLVGEPTCPDIMGDMMKIGRRGSTIVWIEVDGIEGHVAYPHLADNPITRLVHMLAELKAMPLDQGTDWFQPSNLEITDISVGNPAGNVIPARAHARLSIRFNDLHTGKELGERVREIVERHGGKARQVVYGEAFLTPPGAFRELIADAVEAELGLRPEASTTGGTSDARFLKDLCPVIEFGLCNATMHKRDEAVAIPDLDALARIYARVAKAALAGASTGSA